jgi:hypothetical protein
MSDLTLAALILAVPIVAVVILHFTPWGDRHANR